MALSLREKLQKASQASIATNAAKTIAKLATMEHPPASAGASLPEEPATDQATHQTTQQATQRPTKRPSKQPSRRPSDPVGDPVSEPAGDPATQSATRQAGDPVGDPESDPQDIPVSDPVNTSGIKADVWETLTPIQRSVLTYLARNQGDIIKYADIAGECRIPVATAQTACRRFKALSFLSSQYGSRGCIKGLRFSLDKKLFDRRKRQDDPESDPVSDGGSDPQGDGAGRRPGRQATHQAIQQATQTPYKEDRQIENLSVSLERIALAWPHLARSGFGVEQVRQAVENLAALGKPVDRVVQGLDHIEYELAHGQLRDKDGQTVADPCSWAFRALAQNGYYRRPKGYVSPAEQAALDAEVEARAVIAARQKAEQAQFEAWRDGLSADAMRAAMAGCPGGPKDAWLRKVWREKHGAR